jgi:hypothetical protein
MCATAKWPNEQNNLSRSICDSPHIEHSYNIIRKGALGWNGIWTRAVCVIEFGRHSQGVYFFQIIWLTFRVCSRHDDGGGANWLLLYHLMDPRLNLSEFRREAREGLAKIANERAPEWIKKRRDSPKKEDCECAHLSCPICVFRLMTWAIFSH